MPPRPLHDQPPGDTGEGHDAPQVLDVRRALLDAAADELTDHGAAGTSLRAIARRAGVSHAAPKHHFGDRAGLLTAVAADGFRRLAATQRAAAPGGLHALGVSYVDFGTSHPALFELMFASSELRPDDPDLLAAHEESLQPLREAAGGGTGAAGGQDTVVMAWVFAHGLVVLQRAGALGAAGGEPAHLLATFSRLLPPTRP